MLAVLTQASHLLECKSKMHCLCYWVERWEHWSRLILLLGKATLTDVGDGVLCHASGYDRYDRMPRLRLAVQEGRAGPDQDAGCGWENGKRLLLMLWSVATCIQLGHDDSEVVRKRLLKTCQTLGYDGLFTYVIDGSSCMRDAETTGTSSIHFAFVHGKTTAYHWDPTIAVGL